MTHNKASLGHCYTCALDYRKHNIKLIHEPYIKYKNNQTRGSKMKKVVFLHTNRKQTSLLVQT